MNFAKKLSENKTLEIDTLWDDELQDYFRFDIHWRRTGDHAGFYFIHVF